MKIPERLTSTSAKLVIILLLALISLLHPDKSLTLGAFEFGVMFAFVHWLIKKRTGFKIKLLNWTIVFLGISTLLFLSELIINPAGQITKAREHWLNEVTHKLETEDIKISKFADVNNDNKAELLLITTGKGCASCHQNTVYVFNASNQVLFNTTSDDASFIGNTSDSFAIKQPVRKENEPMCCPSEFKDRIFKWNGSAFLELGSN